MKRLFKTISTLFLATGLLFVLTTAAFAVTPDPRTAFSDDGYYGDIEKCSMSTDMAIAYSTALAGAESNSQAILLDSANDGKPLMLTSVDGMFYVWRWDGSKASSYNFFNDAETSDLEGPYFGTHRGQAAILMYDGINEKPNYNVYTISNGNLTLAHRHTSNSNDSDCFNQSSVRLYQWRYNTLNLSEEWTSLADMQERLQRYAILKDAQGPYTPRYPSFSDVPFSHYAYTPVQWAVENGITAGTSATTFSPNQTCSVAHILTFLWRSLGEPEPTIANPFSNIRPSDYYYKAALWAVENDLIEKYEFNPNKPCTRAMAVHYFWELNGYPPSSGKTFSDVSPGTAYAGAVSWAVDQGITAGTSATTFSPNQICTRAQIVSFLYRMLD